MEDMKIIHDFVGKEAYENEQVIDNNSIITAFLQSVEFNAGTKFYSRLMSIFDAYCNLIGDSGEYQKLAEPSNKVLNDYSDLQKSIKEILKKYDKTMENYVEPLFDIEYHEEFDEQARAMKADFDEIFDKVIEMNSLMKVSASYDDDMKTYKDYVKQDLAEIRTQYGELKNMGAVNIFKTSCKINTKSNFKANLDMEQFGGLNFNDLFGYLWDLAQDEAQVLIDVANESMSLAGAMSTGTEKISDQNLARYDNLMERFKRSSTRLCALTDSELVDLISG